MPQTLTLAVSQSRTLSSLPATLSALESTVRRAAAQHIDLILFPEAYLGGYPRTCTFGSEIGNRAPSGRDQYLAYWHQAVDLGDTNRGEGERWLRKELPGQQDGGHVKGEDGGRRRDATREFLERVARETGVFIVTGLVERAGGSLYCACLYVEPARGVIGKRRKVMPTGQERIVWAQGSPSTLKAVTTTIRGVKLTLAAAICWENFMPLLRYSIYSQGVNLYLAPTADARDTWLSLMRTVAHEGRAFVLSANQCMTRNNLPEWITGKKKTDEGDGAQPTLNGDGNKKVGRSASITKTEEGHEIQWPTLAPNLAIAVNGVDEKKSSSPLKQSAIVEEEEESDNDFVSRGGSCIVGPLGEVLAGPLWEVEDGGLLTVNVDFEDCARAKLDFDVSGHYSRDDAFHLSVEGLDLGPPTWKCSG